LGEGVEYYNSAFLIYLR